MVNNRFAPPLGNPVFTTGLVTNQSLPPASEVFTPVCDSVHRGGEGGCMAGCVWRGRAWRGGVCIAKDVHGGGGGVHAAETAYWNQSLLITSYWRNP